jgi:hypothetical protein
MATPESSRPIESERAKKVFPIKEKSVKNTIAQIEKASKTTHIIAVAELRGQNPHVSSHLEAFADYLRESDPGSLESFATGALFTYRILVENTNLSGKRPPELQIEDINGWHRDNFENNPDSNAERMVDMLSDKWNIFANEEKEIAKGINRLTRLVPYKEGYQSGAYFMASLFKRHDEMQEIGHLDFDL